MADKRITDVDFIESLDGGESFFINQNSTLKQINQGNVLNSSVFSSTFEKYQTKHITRTVTLLTGGWSSKKQTVSVNGVTNDNTVIVVPSSDSYIAYNEAMVHCSAQGSGTLTFSCDTLPTVTLSANILILN